MPTFFCFWAGAAPMPPRSGDFALFGSHLCHFQRFLARISPMARPSWRANARQPSHISCARIMHTQTEPQHERDAARHLRVASGRPRTPRAGSTRSATRRRRGSGGGSAATAARVAARERTARLLLGDLLAVAAAAAALLCSACVGTSGSIGTSSTSSSLCHMQRTKATATFAFCRTAQCTPCTWSVST